MLAFGRYSVWAKVEFKSTKENIATKILTKLNNISFLNFKSNFKTNRQNNSQASNVINFSQNKLAPLAKDTVSFSGSHKYRTDIYGLMATFHNESICDGLYRDAQEVRQYLHDLLDDYFKAENLVYDKETNPNGIIESITSRVKSPGSIREKIFTRLARDFEPSEDDDTQESSVTTFSPYNKDAIKKNIRDVAGSRLVIREITTGTMDKITEQICKMIEDNDLIITEIENHISKPKEELQMILLLLCIENNLFKNNNTEIQNLYYLKMPEEFKKYYPETTKGQKFHFIYKNTAFIN